MIESGVTDEAVPAVTETQEQAAPALRGQGTADFSAPATPARDKSEPTAASAQDKLNELRRLLFGGEQEQLRRLQQRLDDTDRQTAEVSQVLPGAIRLRGPRDKHLSSAMSSTVEESLSLSVRANPQRLSEVLYPVIGPAIRAAVAHALSSMMQSLNETLNRSFSVQGLKWRVEAMRTGKSFAEVVLLHTLLYRVEQVFIIHKQTGLPVMQAIVPAVAAQDPQLISGMLTAIQDFVRDSFTEGEDRSRIRTLDMEGMDVWAEQGPHAVLAAVIRGEAPQELRLLFQEVLENIHRNHAADLAEFDGETALFEISQPELQRCLVSQLANTSTETTQRKISPLLIAVPALLLALLGVWLFFSVREGRRWNEYVSRLKAEPGIVVVEAEKHSNNYFVSGLRDPLAKDPTEILQTTQLDPAQVSSVWQPYQDLSPQFVVARAKTLLQPPAGVTLEVQNNQLRAVGPAPTAWVAEATRLVRFLPGVSEFRFDTTTQEQMIRSTAIEFLSGSDELSADQSGRLQQLATALLQIRAARQSAPGFRIQVNASTDELGDSISNEKLRLRRAEHVIAFLRSHGVDGPFQIEHKLDNQRQVRLAVLTDQ